MNKNKPLISVVVAAYNESENLPELYRQLISVFQTDDFKLEILVIDDGSSDGTLDWLRSAAQKDPRLRYISFSRNFGHQAAVTAGLQHATGDAVVIMDADLQDPPEAIPDMIQAWLRGAQVVTARRVKRDVDPLSKRIFASLYYRVLSRLAETKIPVDSGDFSLLDRVVVNAFNSLPERNRYVRGLRAWLGFAHCEVSFNRRQRLHGQPKYSFFKSLTLAINGLVSFSHSPLRLATYLGLGMGVFALAMVVLVMYWRFFTNAPLTGYTIIITTFLLICSVQLIIFGIMGEYIARIYDEVKARPQYVVKEVGPDEIAQTKTRLPETGNRWITSATATPPQSPYGSEWNHERSPLRER
jgi:glycosyltransferase involved in cell wall biosynthesis